MTENKTGEFLALVADAVRTESLRKLIFSRPVSGDAEKITGRLVAHRGRRMLALEYALRDTVRQENIPEGEIGTALPALLSRFSQVNLLTALGDAEFKRGKRGEVLLGAEKLRRRFAGEVPDFVSCVESLDRKKEYLLSGKEDFLILLGISDAEGRVHDKKQPKFRQINRFLDHIAEVFCEFSADGVLHVYDLCCGKSYLSFAVYYYLHTLRGRDVNMLCVDRKDDVIRYCEQTARALGYDGMHFESGDIRDIPTDVRPDLVISLHACDVATDIVLDKAAALRAKVILSTPCCHRYLNDRISQKALAFITDYPQLRNKLCEAATDALRLSRLRAAGYRVRAMELTDPDDTPKNTLLRAVLDEKVPKDELLRRRADYEEQLAFLLGERKDDYLKGI